MLTSWVCARHPLGAPQFTYARAGSTRRSTKQGSIALRGTRRLRIPQAGAPLSASTPPLQLSSPPPCCCHEPGPTESGLHPLISVGVIRPPLRVESAGAHMDQRQASAGRVGGRDLARARARAREGRAAAAAAVTPQSMQRSGVKAQGATST